MEHHQINIKESNLSSVTPLSPNAKIHQIIVEDNPLTGAHFELSRQSVGGETIKKPSDFSVI